jgi:chromosome segregation ATPase
LQEERALASAKQDLDAKATAVQQNCNRMDSEFLRAEEERRIVEQQLLIVQGDVELVKARVEAMKRRIQQDTATIMEMESSTARTSARIAECKLKTEAALKKLGKKMSRWWLGRSQLMQLSPFLFVFQMITLTLSRNCERKRRIFGRKWNRASNERRI